MALALTQYFISLIFCFQLVVNESNVHDKDSIGTCRLPSSDATENESDSAEGLCHTVSEKEKVSTSKYSKGKIQRKII